MARPRAERGEGVRREERVGRYGVVGAIFEMVEGGDEETR